jgi:hypothetical protein
MEDLARRFCRQALERSGLRYSEELRQVAMEYARWAEGRGQGRQKIAEALGLCEATLSRWLQGDVGAALHEVVVVESGVGSDRPVLVMPSGLRVEGLSERELVSVLATFR